MRESTRPEATFNSAAGDGQWSLCPADTAVKAQKSKGQAVQTGPIHLTHGSEVALSRAAQVSLVHFQQHSTCYSLCLPSLLYCWGFHIIYCLKIWQLFFFFSGRLQARRIFKAPQQSQRPECFKTWATRAPGYQQLNRNPPLQKNKAVSFCSYSLRDTRL